MQGRQGHASITLGARTMIVGGNTSGRFVSVACEKHFSIIKLIFSAVTEIWDFENNIGDMEQPILNNYMHGIGLYIVDFDFCKKES